METENNNLIETEEVEETEGNTSTEDEQTEETVDERKKAINLPDLRYAKEYLDGIVGAVRGSLTAEINEVSDKCDELSTNTNETLATLSESMENAQKSIAALNNNLNSVDETVKNVQTMLNSEWKYVDKDGISITKFEEGAQYMIVPISYSVINNKEYYPHGIGFFQYLNTQTSCSSSTEFSSNFGISDLEDYGRTIIFSKTICKIEAKTYIDTNTQEVIFDKENSMFYVGIKKTYFYIDKVLSNDSAYTGESIEKIPFKYRRIY